MNFNVNLLSAETERWMPSFLQHANLSIDPLIHISALEVFDFENPKDEFPELKDLRRKIYVKRKIAVCLPASCEWEKIENLYDQSNDLESYLSKEMFRELCENQGVLKIRNRIHHLVVLKNPFSTVIGILHVSTNLSQRICSVKNIIISHEERRKGYGSLLLLYGLTRAFLQNCKEFRLDSTHAGAPLYARFYFRPANVAQEEWNRLPLEERSQILYHNAFKKTFTLDLQNRDIQDFIAFEYQNLFS